MIKISEINFLPDSTGLKRVVPDLTNTFSSETLAKSDFEFFIIRQINSNGEPNGLYLKNVSSLRTSEQNAISKYKFQSLTPSGQKDLSRDKFLVKLQPLDVLDLPEHTKNQKEYACFESLLNRKAELVPVFRKKPIENITSPEGFKINFTKNDGSKVKLTPIIKPNNMLYYHEAQLELNDKLNKLPSDNLTTQYLFNGNNLTCCIPRSEYKETINIIEKTITDSAFTYDFKIKVIDDSSMENTLKGKSFNVGKAKGEKVYNKFINKTFNFKYNSGYSETNIKFKNAYLDSDCTIPFSDKYNLSSKFDYTTLYVKTSDIDLTANDTPVTKNISDSFNYFTVSFTFNKSNNYQISKSDLKLKFEEKAGRTLEQFSLTTSSGSPLEFLNIKQVTINDYKISYKQGRMVNIDGQSLYFDFDTEGKGYCANITSIIEQQKNQNSVWHYFVDNSNHHVLEVVQFTKEKIFLRLARGSRYNSENFETAIKKIGKRKYRDNNLMLHIKNYSYNAGERYIIKSYTIPCNIEAVFAGVESYYGSDYNEISWYVADFDLTEVQKTYPNITESYLDSELYLGGLNDIYSIVVDTQDRWYKFDWNPHYTANKPNYRVQLHKRGCYETYYIPETITNSLKNNRNKFGISFTSIEDARRWQFSIWQGANK